MLLLDASSENQQQLLKSCVGFEQCYHQSRLVLCPIDPSIDATASPQEEASGLGHAHRLNSISTLLFGTQECAERFSQGLYYSLGRL